MSRVDELGIGDDVELASSGGGSSVEGFPQEDLRPSLVSTMLVDFETAIGRSGVLSNLLKTSERSMILNDLLDRNGVDAAYLVEKRVADFFALNENFNDEDLLAFASDLRDDLEIVPDKLGGALFFNLADVVVPGTEFRFGPEGTDIVSVPGSGRLVFAIIPEGAVPPFHHVVKKHEFGLATNDSLATEWVMGLRGELRYSEPGSNGHRSIKIDSGDLKKFKHGDYLSFSPQQSVWMGLVLMPMGFDRREMRFIEPKTFSSL